MKPLLLIGGAALLAYYAYSKGMFGALLPSSGTPAPTPTPGTPAPGGQLTTLQSALLSAAAKDTGNTNPLLSADQWGFYYALPTVAGTPAPAPDQIFGSSFDGTARTVNGALNIPFATYWGALSPYLASKGMSGLGMSGLLPAGWA
jgi:hypothetical protein